MIKFTDKDFHGWRLLVYMAFVIAAGLSELACVSTDKAIHATIKPDKSSSQSLDASDTALIEERWGVKLQGIQITAAGHMLDFRFRVIDPAKAAPLVDKKKKASVIIEKTGTKLGVPNVPRIGSLRQSSKQVKPGMMFAILFANPGKMVTPGQQLTVQIGDFSVEHITVGEILNAPPASTTTN